MKKNSIVLTVCLLTSLLVEVPAMASCEGLLQAVQNVNVKWLNSAPALLTGAGLTLSHCDKRSASTFEQDKYAIVTAICDQGIVISTVYSCGANNTATRLTGTYLTNHSNGSF